MKTHVSNLPGGTPDANLAATFEPVGFITPAHVMSSWDSGRARDVGFVEMMQERGERAPSKLNGQETDGPVPRVNEAETRL